MVLNKVQFNVSYRFYSQYNKEIKVQLPTFKWYRLGNCKCIVSAAPAQLEDLYCDFYFRHKSWLSLVDGGEWGGRRDLVDGGRRGVAGGRQGLDGPRVVVVGLCQRGCDGVGYWLLRLVVGVVHSYHLFITWRCHTFCNQEIYSVYDLRRKHR